MESLLPPPSLPNEELPAYSNHGDKTSKLYAENEYLKERVRSCEKGLSALYQLLMPKEPPRVLTTHYRSASLTMRSRSNSHTSPSPIPDTHSTKKTDSKKVDEGRVVTFPELKEAIVKVVEDRDQLAMELDDYRQITEAAKRERVLAIEEKDVLLKESHELRVTLEKLAGKLKEADIERRELTHQIKNMEKDVNILQRSNEEAMVMRAIAVDERSKLIDDYSRLQNELTSVQNERSELLDETLQLQSTISQLTNENGAVVQRKHSNHGYSTISEGSRAKTELGGLRVKLTRITPGQPWGFSVDGGSDCYHGDQSIVVSEVIENMPAHKVLLAGDRLQFIGSYDLRSVTKKEALEIIRSCDQVSVDVMIRRTATLQKPLPQEVRIPGKKSFGFSYEMRVFVSAVDREAQAAGTIRPGDEIVQVMGKQTLNMKPSILKQLLKSCKDGVSMTIQAPVGVVPNGNVSPGKRLRYSSDSNYSQGTHIRTSGEVPHSSYQAPGTPGSSVSETSAGYHSLTHSMPSILSNAVPVTLDTKTGQTGLEPVQHDYRTQSQLATYQEEGLGNPEPHPTTAGGRFRAGSVFSSSRHRPRNLPRRSTVPAHLPNHSTQLPPRVRSTSQSSYLTSQTGLSSPRGYPPPVTPTYRHRGTSLPRGIYPPDHPHSSGHALSQGHAPQYDHFSSYIQRRKQVISMSADNLDFDPMAEPHPPPSHHTQISRTASHGNHMTTMSSHNVSVGANHMTRAVSRDCQMNFNAPKRRPISMSMGSMTNV